MHVRRIPKVSISMALTTKIVTEKAKKWPKMARFWPKSRYNGRVLAREVFFYQCLWVTKFCAKFGCSRTPRTARAPNSFIVLRCVWKEPAPLNVQRVVIWFPLHSNPLCCLKILDAACGQFCERSICFQDWMIIDLHQVLKKWFSANLLRILFIYE